MPLPAPFGLWQLSLCDSATGVMGGVGKAGETSRDLLYLGALLLLTDFLSLG